MGLNITDYGTHREARGFRGVSREAIYNALQRGWIEREPDGTIDPEKADASWALKTTRMARPEDLRARAPRKAATTKGKVSAGDANEDEDIWEAKLRKERALATKAELDVATRKGELISVTSLERRAAGVAAVARQGLESMPARLAPTLAGLTDTHLIRDALEVEVARFLSDLVDGLGRLTVAAEGPADDADTTTGNEIS